MSPFRPAGSLCLADPQLLSLEVSWWTVVLAPGFSTGGCTEFLGPWKTVMSPDRMLVTPKSLSGILNHKPLWKSPTWLTVWSLTVSQSTFDSPDESTCVSTTQIVPERLRSLPGEVVCEQVGSPGDQTPACLFLKFPGSRWGGSDREQKQIEQLPHNFSPLGESLWEKIYVEEWKWHLIFKNLSGNTLN